MPPHELSVIAVSIDDFYLTHQEQLELASRNAENPLLQHRGQPSTHDIDLATSVLTSLRQRMATKIPSYDKSAFDGQGDRAPLETWTIVDSEKSIDVVLFEGWCVGFEALTQHDLRQKWDAAVAQRNAGEYIGRLGHNSYGNVERINEALKEYDTITK